MDELIPKFSSRLWFIYQFHYSNWIVLFFGIFSSNYVINFTDKNLLFDIASLQVHILNTTTTLQTYRRQSLHYSSMYFLSKNYPHFLFKNFWNQLKGNANEQQFIFSSSWVFWLETYCSTTAWEVEKGIRPMSLRHLIKDW